MANLLLVDSSFYITRLRQGFDPLRDLDQLGSTWDVAVCGMVMIETLRGRKEPRVRAAFAAAFSEMAFLPVSLPGWQRIAGIAWDLARQGHQVPGSDLAIAAAALEADATLLTFDAHFDVVPGLRATSAVLVT